MTQKWPKMAIFGHFGPPRLAKRASFLRCLEEDMGPCGHRGPKRAKNGHFGPFWALLATGAQI